MSRRLLVPLGRLLTSIPYRWSTADKSSERRADLAAIQTDDQFKIIRNGLEVIEKFIRGGSTVSAMLKSDCSDCSYLTHAAPSTDILRCIEGNSRQGGEGPNVPAQQVSSMSCRFLFSLPQPITSNILAGQLISWTRIPSPQGASANKIKMS